MMSRILIVVLLLGSLTPAARADVDAATVSRSIRRGVEYLRKNQTERGGWPEYGRYTCGLSALCTLSLLNAGVPADDPAMVRALRYLRGFEPRYTYSVALQTLVFCQVGAAGDLPRIRRNVRWLVDNQIRGPVPSRVGSWSYGRGNGGMAGSGDPSNAQFALLALGAAQDRGIEVDAEVFRLAIDYWMARQRDGGSWSYSGSMQPSGSMTCAGIASLIIGRGGLEKAGWDDDGSIRCCGGGGAERDRIERALGWLGENFSVEVNPGGQIQSFFYYLYALERVGRLSGRRFIGPYDWYRQGAERLVNLQDQFQGFWVGSGPLEPRLVATSFALLFLSKGKRRVVIGQLKYEGETESAWRTHWAALPQLIRHVERDWGQDLTWQIVQAKTATLEGLLQTPVLMISGKDGLAFAPELVEVLGEYIDQGGTIVFDEQSGNGCGTAPAFRRDAEALVERWFDGADVGLRRLPPNHPVWSAERRVTPTAIADDYWVEGVQACCRTSVFYSPDSLSCRWALGGALFESEPIPDRAEASITTAIGIGENILAYATGRELKDKLDERFVIQPGDAPELGRGAILMATLSLDAGGQEARRALSNAALLVSRRTEVPIVAVPRPIGFDTDALADVMFLWVHGRTSFRLDQDRRATLKRFVENGGTILGSSICGSEAFADSFRDEMEVIFGASGERLPADHPVMRAPGGFDISSVTIRSPGVEGGKLRQRSGAAVLEAIEVDNVLSVFFSPLDLSCALESPNSIQCPGYDTEDAARIVANLVLHSLVGQ